MHAQEKSVLEVTPAEAGQKLMQFLQRRLSLPQTLLHRWVRTGQIRRNGGRCKPFEHVDCGDMVRLPPFAFSMNESAVHPSAPAGQGHAPQSSPHASARTAPPSPLPPLAPLPPQIHADDLLLVFNKPAGLPVHPGTGHSDALTTRLAQHCAHLPFLPTPAHRLDKDTSGLLLVASAYSSLRALQDAFRHRHMVKEYVAWVQGLWPHDQPVELRHHLAKAYMGSDEKMRVREAAAPAAAPASAESSCPAALPRPAHAAPPAAPTDAKEAVCIVQCLRRDPDERDPGTGRSLMHIRLITGRTHQIRAQLAAVGHALCGDFKYGSPDTSPTRHGRYAKGAPRPLYLHSLRIILPDVPELASLPREFTALPPWQGRMALQELPPPLTVPSS